MLQLAANETPTPAPNGLTTSFALEHTPVDAAHVWAHPAFSVGCASAANTVKVTIGNLSGAGVTPGAIRFQITVIKH